MLSAYLFELLPCSARMSSRQDRTDDGGWGAGALHQVQRDFPQSADPARTGGSSQNLWWKFSFFSFYIFVPLGCSLNLIHHLTPPGFKNSTFIIELLMSIKNNIKFQVISMDSTQTCWGYSSMEVSLRRPTICSWGITWTEGNSHWRPSACSSPTRSNTQKISSCSGGTMSAPLSIEYTASMMSVS